MFYFSDVDSYLEINPMLYESKAFANGFGIAIWFRIEAYNGVQTSDEVPTLFSIYANGKGGFEAYFSGDTLYYKTMKGKQYVNGPEANDIEVYTFEPGKWYQLYIFHSRKYVGSEVKFFVNTQLISEQSLDYPKMDDVGKLDRGYICKNFTGQVSSVIMLSGHVSSSPMLSLLKKFPKEVNAEKLIDEIDSDKCKEDKIKDKLFALFVPSRVQSSPTGDVYVEFSNTTNKGRLGPLSGVF